MAVWVVQCQQRLPAMGGRVSGHPCAHVVGDEWFEGLRPHLPTTGEAAKFRTAYEVRCDNPTLMVLSLEIGRIEKEWMVEASGRTPKHRG